MTTTSRRGSVEDTGSMRTKRHDVTCSRASTRAQYWSTRCRASALVEDQVVGVDVDALGAGA